MKTPIIYPSQPDLVNAVLNWKKCVLDKTLQNSIPRKKNNNLYFFSGAYSCVFAFDAPNQTYALRCWHTNIGDQKMRYKLIDNCLKQVKLPYFIDFEYVEQGIIARNARWDVIRMGWRNESKLKPYIQAHLKDKAKLDKLAGNFVSMFESLHKNQIAHGDLQHENILVTDQGSIILIDYDSLYMPAMARMPDIVKGLPGYQHPSRITKCKEANVQLDYFSELIIYLSLRAMAEKPNLWKECKVETSEDLLFNSHDILDIVNSNIFKKLQTMSKEVKELTDQLAAYCTASSVLDLKPFEDTYNTSIAEGIIANFPQYTPRPAPPKEPDASEEILKRLGILKK